MPRVVYDTHHDRTCPRCRKRASKCRCGGAVQPPPGDGVVRIRREMRNGKTLTAVLGVPLQDAELRALAKELKHKCGTGGTAKAGTIEIQGDHRELVEAELAARGYTVKRAGG